MFRSRLAKLSIALILGCIGGVSFVFVWPYLPIGSWSRYEPLPSKALRFMGHDDEESFFGGVYVKAADGLIYRCQNLNLPCMASTEFNPEVYPGIYSTCDSPIGISPLAPGKVIDKLSYRFCGIDGSDDRYYIILDDGSVWNWNSRGWAAMSINSFLLFGMLIGGVSGVIVWLLFNVFSRKQYGALIRQRPTQRAADLGYAPRFQAFIVASSVSRFEGESTLPPQAANASR